jgi:hypothetical protein
VVVKYPVPVNNKNPNVIQIAIQLFESGKYTLTDHALQRMKERNVTTQDIYDTLIGSRRNEKDDRFNDLFKTWNYSLIGYDEDGTEIELIIALSFKLVFISVVRIK